MEVQTVEREQLARQLIGPRGGLPSLKEDLIRLAHLVHVDVEPKDTVAMLQAKVKPLVADIMGKTKTPTSKEPTRPKSAAQPKAKSSSAKAASSSTSDESMTSSWSMLRSPDLSQMEARMQEMVANQEQRFQSMLNQVMQHVMTVSQVPANTPIEEDDAM